MVFDIVIIGAGAAGLASAYRAASTCSQLKILVLEKEKLPGRKLSAAGNGKCNLTNRRFDISCYHSDDEECMKEWVNAHSHMEIVSFFEDMGILLYESGGYYYPQSNQGKQVTKLLWERCVKLKVQFAFEQKVCKLYPRRFFSYAGGMDSSDIKVTDRTKKDLPLYEIQALDKDKKNITYKAKNVIMATGGLAAPKLGGSDAGYRLLSDFSLSCRETYPVLCPIYVEDALLEYAKGVRLDAVVTLKNNDERIRERGQVQFNRDCLSGIVIMNLSGYYYQNRCHDFSSLYLDVLPDITWDNLKGYFIRQQKYFPVEQVSQLLSGILPNSFAIYIMNRLNLAKDMPVEKLSEKQINRLTSALKKLAFTPIYYEDYNKSQATGGGISLSEIQMNTFQSVRHPGLYLTGELLDVNGKCGGYNLTFAILSGMEAAECIVKQYKEVLL